MLPSRPLGGTGMQVSLLGLGSVKFGRNADVKYPRAFELPDDRTVTRLLDHARALGVNLLDTAPAYGTSEDRLGELLQHQPADHWLICTKTGETWSRASGSSHDFTPEFTRRSVERSLRRLRRDVLDVVLVHSDGDDETILRLGTLEALQALRQAGLIRAVGFSGKTVAGGRAATRHSDVVMVTLSTADREELPVLNAAHERGCGVLVKKALGSGHLALDQGSASLRWVAAQPAVSSIVVGTLSTDHLSENCAALDPDRRDARSD